MHLVSMEIMKDITEAYTILAKGQPKILNSATFGMNIHWPKMMFQCCPRIQMDVLRPPLLIYVSKNRILIS